MVHGFNHVIGHFDHIANGADVIRVSGKIRSNLEIHLLDIEYFGNQIIDDRNRPMTCV